MAKLDAWFVLEKPVNKEQNTTEKVLDTTASITKEGLLSIAENTPGIALIKQNGTDAYNTYKRGGDGVDIAIAAIGLDDVQADLKLTQLSAFSKISRAIVDAIAWLLNTLTLGMCSGLLSTIARASLFSAINKGEEKIINNRMAKLFHTKDPVLLEKISEMVDANYSQSITNLELNIAAQLLDLDKDGTVSEKEIAQFGGADKAALYVRSKNEVLHTQALYSENWLKSRLIKALGKSAKKVVENRWNELDFDNSGHVDAAEFHKAFDPLDTNKNHLISRQELYQKSAPDGNALFDWVAKNQNSR